MICMKHLRIQVNINVYFYTMIPMLDMNLPVIKFKAISTTKIKSDKMFTIITDNGSNPRKNATLIGINNRFTIDTTTISISQ